MPLEIKVRKTFQRLLGSLKKLPYEVYEKKRPNHEPTVSNVSLARHIVECMVRSDALKSHIYPDIFAC